MRAPSWRPDIENKADLVEEIIRLAGLDRIAPAPLERDSAISGPVLTLLQKRVRTSRRALAARGMVEAVTWSFVAKARLKIFGGGEPDLSLANPIAADLSDMRPSLLPGLIAAAKSNLSRGFGDVALFEVGQVFKSDAEDGQFVTAAGLRRGTAKPSGAGRHWSDKAAPVRRIRRARPTHSRCWRRWASPPTPCRSCRVARISCIPAVRRRCNSVPKTSSAGSAKCIRAYWSV